MFLLTEKVAAGILSFILIFAIMTSDKMEWLPIWGKVICSVLWLIFCMWIIGGVRDAK